MGKKKIIGIVISIILVIVILLGTTYAVVFRNDQTEEQSYTTGLLEITSSATNGSVTLTNSIPLSDEEGSESIPYTFTITNTGNLTYKFDVMLLSTTTTVSNQINSQYIKVKVNNNEVQTLNDLTNSKILTEQTLTPGQSINVTLRVWLSLTTPNTEIGKTFSAKIATNGEAIYTILSALSSEAMLAKLNLTSNGELELPITDVETSNAGIFEMEDDLGTSYYFRGAATNNYVKFGKWKTDWYDTGATGSTKIASAGDDMYWRIVRINGDGTIRMIYDGTQLYANGNTSNGLNRSIGKSKFNSNYNKNAYVGYMYGVAGASTYAAEHANTNNSTIKTYIDNWYQTQLSGTTYESNIADAIYCNDRKVATNVSNYQAWWGDESKTVGTGINTSDTLYGIWDRLTYVMDEDDMDEDNFTEINPILTCPQVNDQFTLTTSNIGNKKLTYPVGLITADEIILAGEYMGRENYNSYLTTGTWYLSGAPFNFIGGRANAWLVGDNGDVSGRYGVYNAGAVRPLVSLSSSTNFTGSGTLSDPFVISNNG